MNLPKISNHGSEIILLGILGVGVVVLIGMAIALGRMDGLDIAAFLLVLQRIVEAVQKRWEQRSVDLMGRSLANAPPAEPATLPAEGQG